MNSALPTVARPAAAGPPFECVRRHLAALAALLGLPFLLLRLDPNWIYAGASRDPWIYYGYFRFARIYLHDFADYYYSSRLSVILPGYLLHHLLPPLTANQVLHFGLYWVAVFAVYWLSTMLFGHRVGLLSALVAGGHPFFVHALGWNYVDGFGMAYLLLGMLCAALAPRFHYHPLLLAGIGAAAVSLVTANVSYGLQLPLLVSSLVFAGRQAGRPVPSRSGLWILGGAILACGAFAAISRFWGEGHVFFLRSSLHWVGDFIARRRIEEHRAGLWLGRAVWLVFPATVAAAAIALLLRDLTGKPVAQRAVRFVQWQFLLVVLAFLAWQSMPKGYPLETAEYAGLLLPAAFLAFAGQLAQLVEGLSRRSFALVAAAAFLAATAPMLISVGSDSWQRSETLLSLSSARVVLPLAIALGTVAVVGAGRRGLTAALLVLGFLAASQIVVRADSGLGQSLAPFQGDGPGLMLQMDASLSALRRIDPNLRLRLWYADEEDEGRFYDSLSSTILLCPRIVSTHFPTIFRGRTCDGLVMQPGETIAVLSRRPTAWAEARASLRDVGLGARLLSDARVPGPALPFTMTFLETEALAPEPTGGD